MFHYFGRYVSILSALEVNPRLFGGAGFRIGRKLTWTRANPPA